MKNGLKAFGFIAAFAATSIQAATYTWTTATGTANWNNASSQNNWGTGVSGAFPNAVGDVANVNNNITTNLIINLNTSVSVGVLNLGDLDGSHTFTIQNGTAGPNTLTFDNGVSAAQLNNVGTGALVNSITANIAVGTSTLNVNSGTQGLQLTSVAGSGVLNKRGTSELTVNGNWGFTGTVNVLQGTLATNTGNGRLASAAQYNISDTGYLRLANSNAQIAIVNFPTPAASRLNPSATLNMSGARVSFGGNFSLATNPTIIQESAPTINVNAGTSEIDFTGSQGAAYQYELTLSGLNRAAGTVVQSRMVSVGGTAGVIGTNRAMVAGGISAGDLVGGAGTLASQANVKIIPWMFGTSSSSGAVSSFVTYSTARGFEVVTGENGNLATVASDEIYTRAGAGNATLATSKSVNAVRISAVGGGVDLGVNTLTVNSGAVLFSNNGSISNGILDFGTREGIVFVGANNATVPVFNTGTISSVLDGDSGLTKGGSGILILSGTSPNVYTGNTTVAGGILRMGAANKMTNGAVVVADSQTAVINASGGFLYTPTQYDLNGFSQTVGSLQGGGANGTVALGSASLTTGGDNSSTTFSGVISGSGNLVKQGIGTFTLAAANTYTGTTTVNAGRLRLGASGVIADASNVVLGGGTVDFAAGNFSEGTNLAAGVGTLLLNATSGLDFANGNQLLHFANSNAIGWTGTLNIYNWDGTNLTDFLYFGTDNTGLTNTQLSQISFYSDNGSTLLGVGSWAGSDGQVIFSAVPEPSTYALLGVGLLAMGVVVRRRNRA